MRQDVQQQVIVISWLLKNSSYFHGDQPLTLCTDTVTVWGDCDLKKLIIAIKVIIQYFCRRSEPTRWSHVAKSGENVTTAQCEAYELTKLDHEYEELSGYRNPTAEYELPITKCPAHSLESD